MILFYNRMIAPERKHAHKEIYITTANPYGHWLKKLYILYNKKI